MIDRRAHTRAGKVLVVVLLGISLLAGLVFYVVNVGDQLHRRVVIQNAADSAAISGAAWMARSCNLIAADNVGISRMLALIPHLDAFPLASKMAYEEVEAWETCLTNQLDRGVTDANLRSGLESLRDRMQGQRDILAPIKHYFNDSGFDVATATNWSVRGMSGLPPHGRLWLAAESMDLVSQATAASAGVLAQRNAARYGKVNDAEVAFVVPVLPELPARRTSYDDFMLPVKRGIIPDRAYPQRLGPYDRLFEWRDYVYQNIYERDRWVNGQPGHGAIRGSRGNVSIGGPRRGQSARGHSSNPNGHWAQRNVGRILMGYQVYGPYEWMRRQLHDYCQGAWYRNNYYAGHLPDTFFHEYHRQIADIKLEYMWGDQTLKAVHYPQWANSAGAFMEYPEAVQTAADPNVRVTRTMFYLVEIRSRYPKGHADFLSPGSFKTNADLPLAIWVDGWQDPARWGIPQTDEWIWEDQYSYETTEDWDIGIRMQRDATGTPIWQPVYMIAQYVFGGIDTGGEWPVTNPANYTDRNELPAPILLDTAAGDYDVVQPHHDLGARRNVFSYLGVAGRNDRAVAWANRFESGNPFGGMVGLAQSIVFNNRSWGLWTQDWQCKLVPITQWDDWMGRMDAGIADAGLSGGEVSPQHVQRIYDYLSGFDSSLVAEMANH